MAQYPALALAKLTAEIPVGTGVVPHGESAHVSGPLLVPLPSSPCEFAPQQSTALVEVRMAQ